MEIRLAVRKRCIYFTNLAISLSFGFGVYAFYSKGKPFIRGFYCDDESIDKPFKKSTIPSLEGSIVIALIQIVCFCFVEFTKIQEKRKLCQKGKVYLKSWLINVVYLILLSLYGSGITMFITDVGKYTIGRPRPHFFSVCKPDWIKLNCTDEFNRKNYFIGDQYCTTTDKAALKAARLSFPSGHSSFSAFAATFLILYIENQLISTKWISMPKLFFQVVIGTAAFYVGLSRITDFKHHPGDVLVGFAIGIFVGIILHLVVRKYCYRGKKLAAVTERSKNCRKESDSIHSVL